MKKNIVIFLLSLSTLFFAFKQQSSDIPKDDDSIRDDLAADEVRVVIEDIPKEQVAVETAKEHEAQARIYYEKAFKIFLVTLGLKLSSDQEEELSELVEGPKNYIDKSKEALDSGKDIKVEQVAQDYDFRPSEVFANLLKNNDMVFDHIRDQSIIKRLQRKVLKDPPLYYARSKYVKRIGPLKRIMGDYRGKLFRIAGNKKGRIDDISLSMKFLLKDEKVEGDFSLILGHEGQNYSNSRGNGTNGNVRMRRGMIVIESGPGSFLHFADKRFELANFYTNGELVGFVKLEKI